MREDFRVKGDETWIRLLLGLCLLFCGMPFLGCGADPENRDANAAQGTALAVTVSIPPQAYLIKRIAGDDVKVHTLVHGGESPATYQPTDFQVSEVLRSRVYFRIGVPFENGRWLDAIRGAGKGMKIVDLRQGIELRRFSGCGHAEHGQAPARTIADNVCTTCGHDHGESADNVSVDKVTDHSHDHGEPAKEAADHDHSHGEATNEVMGHDHSHEGADPHVWLSPATLTTMSRTLAQALCELNPAQAVSYRARLDTLVAELDALHEELEATLSPLAGKRIFIYHPAWGYFCDAYGLDQVPIELEGKEPTDEELSRVQEQMREDKAKVIFIQPQIEGKAVDAVARAVGVNVEILDPLAADVIENLRHAARTIAGSFK